MIKDLKYKFSLLYPTVYLETVLIRENLLNNYTATMWLPKGAKEYWSSNMAGEAKFQDTYYDGDFIVAAYALFEDGTQVNAGVKKSISEDFNFKFFTVLDSSGKAYSDDPIDCNDHEDFRHSGNVFILNDDESIEYHLSIQEKQ